MNAGAGRYFIHYPLAKPGSSLLLLGLCDYCSDGERNNILRTPWFQKAIPEYNRCSRADWGSYDRRVNQLRTSTGCVRVLDRRHQRPFSKLKQIDAQHPGEQEHKWKQNHRLSHLTSIHPLPHL
jgi:hypothetical protein